MSLLIIILQILATLLATAIIVSIMTVLLPLGIETHEINTDKKFRGALLFWGGLVKIGLVFPLEPGWKKRLADTVVRRMNLTEHTSQGIRRKTVPFNRIWGAFGKAKTNLPAGYWRQVRHSVKFEPWQGMITLGVENPAFTGMLYGTAQSLLSTRPWSNLHVEADFVNHTSRFVGIGSIKIYPARIVFLAVKYGFKSLKLFP